VALDRNQLPNDPEALKQLVLRQEAWLEALKAEVIRLRRWRFGLGSATRSSLFRALDFTVRPFLMERSLH